jgi:hypothetical protein
MLKIRTLAMVAAIGLTLTAGADTLKLERTVGPAPNGPPRYATMQEVEARFGSPKSRTGPIGDPPITVWHYDDFKVYFEHDRVLHATSRRDGPAGTG